MNQYVVTLTGGRKVTLRASNWTVTPAGALVFWRNGQPVNQQLRGWADGEWLEVEAADA